jgi:hypothetical protein
VVLPDFIAKNGEMLPSLIKDISRGTFRQIFLIEVYFPKGDEQRGYLAYPRSEDPGGKVGFHPVGLGISFPWKMLLGRNIPPLWRPNRITLDCRIQYTGRR